MEKIVKDVVIVAVGIGCIKAYGEFKRILGMAEATKFINEAYDKLQKKKHYFEETES